MTTLALLIAAALLSVRPAANRSTGSGGVDADLPLRLDLVAAALRGGSPVPDALLAATVHGTSDTTGGLRPVARLLQLGADPSDAWRSVSDAGELALVARAALRSSSSGARLSIAFEQAAAELRRQRVGDGLARAERAGVAVLAPLGLCFLPAFVCLGIAPVIVGIAGRTLAVTV